MSQTLSSSFARCYGLARVARVWRSRAPASIALAKRRRRYRGHLLGLFGDGSPPWGFASVKNRIVVRGKQGKRRTASMLPGRRAAGSILRRQRLLDVPARDERPNAVVHCKSFSHVRLITGLARTHQCRKCRVEDLPVHLVLQLCDELQVARGTCERQGRVSARGLLGTRRDHRRGNEKREGSKHGGLARQHDCSPF